MIKIGENQDKDVTYENEPESQRQLFPNIPLTVDVSPLQDAIDALDERMDDAESDIDSIMTTLQTFDGQPGVAETVSDMTDTNKIYVYVGSETGYTSGDWYYYNGTAWVSGGTYVANPVQIDDTLTQAGEAADAKVTGDEIAQIKSDLSDTDITTTDTLTPTWTDGYYYSISSHKNVASENYSVAVVDVTGYDTVTGHSNCDPNGTLGAEFYDSNGTYIANSSFINTRTGNYAWDFSDVTVPANAVSLKITCRLAYKSDFTITASKTEPSIGKQVKASIELLSGINMTLLNGSDDGDYTRVPKWTDNVYVKYSNGVVTALTNYSVAEIDVDGATKVSGYTNLDPNGSVGAWFYDNTDTPISGSGYRPTTAGTYNWNYELNVPSGAVTLRITCRTAYKSSFTAITKGTVPDYNTRINDLQEHDYSVDKSIDRFNALLPQITWHGTDTYIAIVGKQQRVYFDQICHANVPGYYKVSCSGATYPEVTYNDEYVQFDFSAAKSATITIYYLGIYTAVLSSFTISVTAIAEVTYPPIKMMFLGDSLTQDGTMVKTFKDAVGSALTLCGTRGTSPYLHEGRAGWSAMDYCTSASKNSVTNPFYNPTSETFDFAYYMTNNADASGLEYVNVFLGQNDGYQLSHIQYITHIVDSILSYDSNITVTVMGMFHLAKNNSGCGQWMQNTYEYSYKAKLWNDALMTALSSYGDNVIFVPQFENLDSYYDYERSTRDASAANNEQVTYFTNNVHPDEPGYVHFADVLLSYINGQLT